MATPMPVASAIRFVAVTPTSETSALDAGDTVFDRTLVSGAVGANDALGGLFSVTVIDKADQKAALNLVFLKADVVFGVLDAAPSISDTDAVQILGIVTIAAGAWVDLTNPNGWHDLGGVSVASIQGISLPIVPVSGTDDIYVAAFTPGTPTYAAAGALVLNLGFAD